MARGDDGSTRPPDDLPGKLTGTPLDKVPQGAQRIGTPWEARIACGLGMIFWPVANIGKVFLQGTGVALPWDTYFIGLGIFFAVGVAILWATTVKNIFQALALGIALGSFLQATQSTLARSQSVNDQESLPDARVFVHRPFRVPADLRIDPITIISAATEIQVDFGPDPVAVFRTPNQNSIRFRMANIERLVGASANNYCVIAHGRPSSNAITSQILGRIDGFEVTFFEVIVPSSSSYCAIWNVAGGLFSPGQAAYAFPAGEEIARQLSSNNPLAHNLWAEFFLAITNESTIDRLIKTRNIDGFFNIFIIFRNVNTLDASLRQQMCARMESLGRQSAIANFAGPRTRREMTAVTSRNCS